MRWRWLLFHPQLSQKRANTIPSNSIWSITTPKNKLATLHFWYNTRTCPRTERYYHDSWRDFYVQPQNRPLTNQSTDIGCSDVGDNAMLMTTLCWWLYDCYNFKMLAAESLCWWLFQDVDAHQWCPKSVSNMPKLSSTYSISNIRHQHRCSHFWVNQQRVIETQKLGEMSR